MDIQKEREAFEKHIQTVAHPHRSPKVMFFTVNDGHGNVIYCDISIQNQWETWQAAKAQVVPELTDKMIVAIESEVESQLKASAIDADPFRLDGEKIWNAALEAQEPK